MDDILEKIRLGDLYALLTRCTKEELDPIVEILLSRPLNFVDIDDDYKKFQPDHTKYHKVLGDEIRLFGGHSIRNLFRGEGPPYAEIVVDVCKKLGVPYTKDDIVGNEANLLDIYVKKRWEALSPAERQQLAGEARKAAAGTVSTAASMSMGAAAFVVGRFALGPAGWASLGFTLLDANLKVTVPCVLQIAYLRRKILSDQLIRHQFSGPGSPVDAPADRASALVIAAEDGKPVLSLARIPEPPANAAWHKIDASDDGISRLNPLLAAVPSLAVAGEVATTKYMEVVCDGALVAAKTGGGSRAFSMGANGVKSHANLFDPDRLAAMVNVSALMNVASIALAQKHLADISKKLSDIKDGIDGIRKFQKDERRSRLTGAIHYFEQVAPGVLEGERPERVQHQIERLETELLQVQEHITADIDAESKRLENFEDNEWFGSAEATSAIESHHEQMVELYNELVLCLRARSCGWQLLCMFPGEEIGKAHRRRTIQRSLEGLDTDSKMMKETDAFFRKRIHELYSFWNAGSTVNARKLALLKATDTLLADVASSRAAVIKDLEAADEMLVALRQPVPMIARIENGRIAAIAAL